MRSEQPSDRSKKPMFDDKHQKLLNGVSLAVSKALGFSQKHLRSNAYSLDESKLTYVCGKNIVVYDLLTQTQKVFQRPSEEQSITAFGCFKTLYSEDYVIYAARSNQRNVASYVGIINVWKNNVRSYSVQNLQTDEVVTDVLFLLQGAYFVLLSQYENSRITIFSVENDSQPRVSHYLDFSVQAMFTFDPNTEDFYAHNQKEIYQVHFDLAGVEAEKLQIKLEEGESIVCARGMNGNEPVLVYVTDQGYLYLGRLTADGSYNCDREDLGTFETLDASGQVVVARRRPSVLCCNDYNILVGYQLLEELTLIKVSGINYQKRTKQKICFSCPYLHKIVSMNFSEENSGACMVIQLKEGDKEGIDMRLKSQFLRQKGEEAARQPSLPNHNLPPGKIVPVVFNFLLYNTMLETYRSPMNQVLSATVFSKPILGIGMCPFKKILLLLCQKKVVAMRFDAVSSTALTKLFLWECEFTEQPLSLDMHPSNFEVAISFRDGVKTYTMVDQGLRSTNFSYSLKQCECVKYSQYGHFLAASSCNSVVLLNPYSNQLIDSIQVRMNSPLKDVRFVDHDRSLFLHASNGIISVINLQTKAQLDLNNKMKIIAALYDPTHDILVMSYSEYFTKFYKERGTLEYGMMMTYNHRNTVFLVCNEFKTIFMGNSVGAVQCYQWPFQDYHSFDENFTCTQLHEGAVTHMKITTDLAFLVTGAEDGSVFISKIQHFCDGMLTTDSQIINVIRINNRDYAMLYSMERLSICSTSSENLREEKIIQLEADKADYDCDYAQSISQKKQQIHARIETKQQQQKQLKNDDSQRYASQVQQLQLRKKVMEKQIAELITSTEQEKVSSVVATDEKLRQLYLQNERLSNEKKELIASNKRNAELELNRLNTILKQHQDQHNKQYGDMDGRCTAIDVGMADSEKKFCELEKEQIQQFNEYRDGIMGRLEQERNSQSVRGEELRKRLNRITTENTRYQVRKKQLKAITEQIQQEIQELQSEQKEYEKQIKEIGQVLEQKDAVINDEQRKAKQYLKNNIAETNKELYLTYKMKELQEKNKAMETHLQGLEQRHDSMYQQFLEEALTTRRVKDEIEDAKRRLQVFKTRLKNNNHVSYEGRYHYDIFKARVGMLMHNHTDGLQLQFQKLLKEFQKGMEDDKDHEDTAAAQHLQQLKSKRDAMIMNVQKNKQLAETNDSIKKNTLIKANCQTINLTSECNQLRLERNKLMQKLKEVQQKLRRATQEFELASDARTVQPLVEIFPPSLNISTIQKKVKPTAKLPFEKYEEENRLKRLSLALEKNKFNPRRCSDADRIDILNMLRVKEINSNCERNQLNSVNKVAKSSFLEDNSSFLPPIHSRELSILSNGPAAVSFVNQSIGMDSTHLNSIEVTRFCKDSCGATKRNSHTDAN